MLAEDNRIICCPPLHPVLEPTRHSKTTYVSNIVGV